MWHLGNWKPPSVTLRHCDRKDAMNTTTETGLRDVAAPADQYVTEYAQTHDKETSIRHCRVYVKHFVKWLGKRPLDVKALQEFKVHLVRESTSKRTRNLMLSYAKGYLKWLVLRGETTLREIEIRHALKPFKIDSELIDVLDKGQLQRLAEEAAKYRGEHPVGALVLAAMLTGARRGELTSLAVKHIEPEHSKLLLTSHKTRLQREFPFELMGVGAKLFEELKRKNRRLVYDYRAWHEIRTRAELPDCQFKQLRACFSSYAKSAGANPWLIDNFLAHSAGVAKGSYDRALVGIHGDNAPEWYGCTETFAWAVEHVQIERGSE